MELPMCAEFETWWTLDGQYSRAGGGEYEKTFAYNAWHAALASAQVDELTPLPEPDSDLILGGA
jgi:hypothetical protein